MTKKDFILIADAISISVVNDRCRNELLANLCKMLKNVNPKFDERTFRPIRSHRNNSAPYLTT